MGPLFSAAVFGIFGIVVSLVAFLVFRVQRLPFKAAVCSALVFACGGAASAFLVLLLSAIAFHGARTVAAPFFAYLYLCILGAAGIFGGAASVKIWRRVLSFGSSDRGAQLR